MWGREQLLTAVFAVVVAAAIYWAGFPARLHSQIFKTAWNPPSSRVSRVAINDYAFSQLGWFDLRVILLSHTFHIFVYY